ncbi:hypothetical protein [Parvularcula marina]|uniref:hypothetical protein n=2 Tax=Parvularcula marina TaxID=2292771 RepID=UPI00355A6F3D
MSSGAQDAMGRPHLSIMGVIYEALGFAGGHFGTVLRIAWLPLVLIMGLEFYLSYQEILPQGAAMQTGFVLEKGWITRVADVVFALGQGSFDAFRGAACSSMNMNGFGGGSANCGGVGAVKDLLASINPYVWLIFIAAILQASVLVSLTRYAAGVERPHHRSLHLSFGIKHLLFIVTAALSFTGVVFLATRLYGLAAKITTPRIDNLLSTKTVEIASGGGLHPELGPTHEPFEGLNTLIDAADGWLGTLGLGIGTIDLVIFLPFALVTLYLILRLLAWPYLVAAGSGAPLQRSLALSKGLNVLGLFVIVVLWIVLSTATLWVTTWSLHFIFGFLWNGAASLLSGLEGFNPNTGLGFWVEWIIRIMLGGILIAIQAFLVALQAGMGGALVHRA